MAPRKGSPSPFKGKHHSNSTKEVMRQKKLGKIFSEEHKRKLRLAHIGKHGMKRTPEQCENIRRSKQNISEETREKLRIASTGKTNKGILGQERSIESRMKQSASTKGKQKSESHRNNIAKGKIGVPRPDMTNGGNPQQKTPKFGELNSNYTGTTPLMIAIRKLQQYYDWRLAVFTRDNFTSVISGMRGTGNLNAHHIIELQNLVKQHNITSTIEAASCKELWDIDNGITVLDIEHVTLHKK